MELAVSKIGQKVCHCFILHYKNIKIVDSVQVQVARTCEGVNILSTLHLAIVVAWGGQSGIDHQTKEVKATIFRSFSLEMKISVVSTVSKVSFWYQ